MKFKIEQIAIYPADADAALQLLNDLGAGEWANDHVVALGQVYGRKRVNEADLAFNYDLVEGKEFEILHYSNGDHWMASNGRGPSVSHLGMHCTADELVKWREFFAERNIGVAQEVMTQSHTNPFIAGKRTYNYVIFDTKAILGVDLKFIVRIETVKEPEQADLPLEAPKEEPKASKKK